MDIDISKLRIITSPELYNPKTRKPNPNGLFSEQIFGPEISFRCQCGKYSIRELHRDLRCPQCSVICQSNDSRYTTFAKIVLSFPIILPIKNKALERICNKKYKNLLDPLQTDYNTSVIRYLKYDHINDYFSITETFSNKCLPINITGIYSLYIAISYINSTGVSITAGELLKCFSHDVLVTPPQTRYAYINQGKTIDAPEKIISQQINNFYITLVRLSKHAWSEFPDPDNRLEYYINQIRKHKQFKTILVDDDLIMYDGLVSKYQYFVNNIYNEVLKLLSGKDGYIRCDFLGRSVDFSSRAVIVPNPNLKAYQIRVPKIIFIKLFFIEYIRYCLIIGKRSNSQVIKYVRDTQFNTKDFEESDYDDFIEWFFNDFNTDQIDRLVLINRQPTLWRLGIPSVEIVGISEGLAIECSNLILAALNADFDGDTAAIYRLHSTAAKLELNFNSFAKRNIIYDHYDEMIHEIRHEPLYAANVLMMNIIDDNDQLVVETLTNVPDTFDVNINQPILFNNQIYSCGLLLLNKWCGFKDVIITKNESANNISRFIYDDSLGSNEVYHTRLHYLTQKLNYFISSHPKEAASIPFSRTIFADKNTKELLAKLPNNPIIGHHIHNGLVKRMKEGFGINSKLSKLCTTKFNDTQFARVICSIGYIADENNIIDNIPITGNVFSGLNKDQFWRTCPGTRKGIVDKNNLTPKSGFLERSMVINLSPCEIIEEDCGTQQTFQITLKSNKHIDSLKGRYCIYNNQLLLFDDVIKTQGVQNLINQSINFRSSITCATPNFKICKTCFGNYNLPSKYVGVLAAQNVFQNITQLTLRSFHTSGSCTLPLNQNITEFIKDHLINIANYGDTNRLDFDAEIDTNLIKEFSKLEGYDTSICGKNVNWISYKNLTHRLKNDDVGSVIEDVKRIFKKDNTKNNIKTPEQIYEILIDAILSINIIYSSFIEIILCNSYICTSDKLYRYELQNNNNPKIKERLGIRSLHTIISKLLGLLYQPNEKSILNLKGFKICEDDLSIYEKLWLM